MKNIIAHLVGVVCLVATCNLPARAAEETSEPAAHPFGLSLDLGPFTGFGGMVIWRPLDHFGVRGGMNYLKFSLPDFEIEDEFGGTAATYNMEVKYQGTPLLLDFYPWKKSYFRISAGVLLNENEYSIDATGQIEVNGNTYANEQLNSTVGWDDPAPYLAVGGDFFCFDKAKHWSLGWEVGVAYTGSPTVTMTNPSGNIPQGDIDTARQDLEDNADMLKVWVVAKLSVNFRF